MQIMNRGSDGRKGSALVLAILTMMVLMILVGALFLLFNMNIKSYQWEEEELKAMYTAESGANLATYMIVGGSDVPQDTLTMQFLPDSGTGWFALPTDDLGEVRVFVDPDRHNAMVSAGNAYAVRALARLVSVDDTYTYGMETVLMPENFARFACFQEHPTVPVGGGGGWYGDGYTFDGPFHSNGPFCIWSDSPTHDNDPYFYSLNIARQPSGQGFYYNSEGSPTGVTYVPEVGDLQLQPIDRLLLGPPYFDLNVDSIPFGPAEVAWGNAREAAIDGGLYFAPFPAGVGDLASGTRMLIKEDTLFVREDSLGATATYILSALDEPVVWIENGNNDDIFLRGFPDTTIASGVNFPVTIGMNGNLYMSGPMTYPNMDVLDPDNDDLLGLITVHGDFIIADDPGAADWPDPWTIVTDWPGGFNYCAVFMALDGEMIAENPGALPGENDFNVVGGYIVIQEGWTSTPDPSGFTIRCNYDTRLMTMHPPYFPQTQNWNVIYWRDWPELDEDMLEADLI